MSESSFQPPTAHFPEVSLLITHFNRSASLERLLYRCRELNLQFGEIVVSDDGSSGAHADKLQTLKEIFGFKLITVPQNQGLGHNLNKGQDAVSLPFTLYIQEDFIPKDAFPEALSGALSLMKAHPELDIARFYAYFRYPYLKPVGRGFCKMDFKLWKPGYRKFYMYSDHPHLRRSNFLQKFGRYLEGAKGDVTEYTMMISFLKKKGKGIFHENYDGLLEQRNDAAEPSTMRRNFWRESNHVTISALRHLYRHLKMNWDYIT